MFTCTKKFPEIPFAHRQPNHSGHCRLIHGHNWIFEFEFTAPHRDQCGFVIDFGKLGWLKEALNTLDHKIVLNRTDPFRDRITDFLDETGLQNIVLVDDCSAEGLAKWAYEQAYGCLMARAEEANRVLIAQVTVYEDSKNSATYIP